MHKVELFLACDRIHGDLSAYNVLYWQGNVTLIDEANTFAKKGYLNASINYRLEPGGCSASGPTLTCAMAIEEALESTPLLGQFDPHRLLALDAVGLAQG